MAEGRGMEHTPAHKKKDQAKRARRLAKSGRISEKAMSKLAGGEGSAKQETVKADKLTPIA